MLRISLIITIISIALLLSLLHLSPKYLSSPNELSKFQPNQKLIINGIVIKETYTKNNKFLYLNNDLQLKCDFSCPSLLNKNISALTTLESYNNKKYLKVLRLNYIE